MRYPRRSTIAVLSAFTVAALPAYATAHGGKGGGDDHGGGKHGGHHGPAATTPVAALPDSIKLPNAWQPEGIASGPGGQLYSGSLATGAIYRADAKTGTGSVLVPPQAGRISQGLKVAGRVLVVAGGTTGRAYFYDTKTGKNLADVPLTSGTSQVNDVAIGRGGAWFTDSKQPQLYNVTLRGGPRSWSDDHGWDDRGHHGKAARQGKHGGGKPRLNRDLQVTTLPITGALVFDDDPATFETNGIEVLKDGTLLVIQSRTGKLFTVNPKTGVSTEVALSGGTLVNGDGILLEGGRLYVVQNRLNQVAVVKLAKDASSATIERTITSPLFRVPTTVASIGKSLYLVNARFGTPVTPDTDYDIVRVDR